MNPRHPIYIPSKGRAESRLTVRALERLGVPFRIVIEEPEYAAYAAVVDPAKILVLPFTDRGLIPVRNWIWERESGAGWHWQLDDNIKAFYRLNRNLKTPVASGTIFRCAEDFVDRYENVAQAGFNYFMFAPRKAKVPPLYLNARIYSCTLLRNDLPYRYRGVYNEDTDLSLRLLKDGWATVLFNTFLCEKRTTMTVAGGNTPIYQGDGRLKMAASLVEQHPDVARVIWKWGRYQHYVDYRRFRRNKLRLRPGVVLPTGVDNYGMVLRTVARAADEEEAAGCNGIPNHRP